MARSYLSVYCTVKQFRTILADLFFLQCLRNMVCHASISDKNQAFITYAHGTLHWKKPADMDVRDIKEFIANSLNHVKVAAEYVASQKTNK